MFKRQNRLPGGRLNICSSFATPLFILKVKSNNLGLNRFGVVASKKIDKRAVVRNRIKRMLREIILNLNSGTIQGNDMLFIVKHGIINVAVRKCELEVINVLKKGKYIKV